MTDTMQSPNQSPAQYPARRQGRRFVAFLATAFLTAAAVSGTTGDRALGAASHLATRIDTSALLNPRPDVHVMPRRDVAIQIRSQTRSQTRTAAATNNLVYLGGPVMAKANNSVPIFWMPPTLQSGLAATPDPNYISLLSRYFKDEIGRAHV